LVFLIVMAILLQNYWIKRYRLDTGNFNGKDPQKRVVFILLDLNQSLTDKYRKLFY